MSGTVSANPEQICQWCGNHFMGAATTCPRCGSPLRRAARRDDAGWVDLPPIADMARIQIGGSSCQIEGTTVPVADFGVAQGDHVYFSHHVLLWRDDHVTLHQMSMRHGFKRLFAGLPVFMMEAHGPGHVAVSRDEPGETIAVPLNPGQHVHAREHTFLAATGGVAYDYFLSGISLQIHKVGKDQNDVDYVFPIGQYLDKFVAGDRPGLLLLHCAGDCFTRTLADGETLLIKPGALVYKDFGVSLKLHLEAPRNCNMFCRRHIWLRVTGPGRVAIQSCYAQTENENSANLLIPYDASMQNW